MMEIFVVEVQQYAFEVDVAKYLKAVTSEANSPSEIQSVFSPSTYRKGKIENANQLSLPSPETYLT